MEEIDFRIRLSFQRDLSPPLVTESSYDIVRQFESDRGRIINSAAIRRLQQKTQVFPLERNAAVRSRLTHSLEVQQTGRHIVKEIINRLQQEGKLEALGLAELTDPLESVVEMACLMHDIGNPPFGHFGEAAINNWFRQRLHPDAEVTTDLCQVAHLRFQPTDLTDESNHLRRQIRHDLCQFEGNAQAIRLAHTLLKLNLTYAQLACVLKYTRPAYWSAPLPVGYEYLMKKTGYYLAEEAVIKRLRLELGMGEFDRFPLTYIMEAADDISYCIADLEDAVEKNILTVDALCQHLQKAWGAVENGDLFDKIVLRAHQRMLSTAHRRSMQDQFFMELRVQTIKRLVPHAARRFIDNLPAIFQGNFNQALLEDSSPAFRLLTVFKHVAARHVFNHPEVEELELQGYRVISGLLDIYSPLLDMPRADFQRLIKEDTHPAYPIETRLLHKLSVKHRLAYHEALEGLAYDAASPLFPLYEYYYRARLLQDYISGMTDLYAYDEYRRLMAAE